MKPAPEKEPKPVGWRLFKPGFNRFGRFSSLGINPQAVNPGEDSLSQAISHHMHCIVWNGDEPNKQCYAEWDRDMGTEFILCRIARRGWGLRGSIETWGSIPRLKNL
ncbi:MAG: hypothetical protein EHM41_07705 [Chloroflexi bacterium]|nr:MAG: hypothetical protein EHM41_07705 [Chloroflexota bacterium]